ncbi:hypothetical protein SCLCIDRAFT_27303 [Scleroderma citrinum Foug A]|uniref:Uncharacterized protein n=1 Tax=Scleroderma citrinum Foug A TaxID=1036808 RepID=A0A0C3DU36_9AGAM|nr:hypothetical protein SCLCIDRAFT_27303 [Scleroderma citrinum Foug A]
MSDSGPPDDPPPAVNPPPVANPPSTVIPPHTTVATRRQTSTYGKLMTGKTKEELINHPTIYSSIITADQVQKHLTEHSLLGTNQDPDHSTLSLALLNIAYAAPGITVIAADTIHSVAILIDTLPSLPSTCLASTSPQINTLINNFKAQVNSLKACIEDIRKTMEINKSSAETLTRTIDEARDELHNTAQFINDTAEELTGIPSQIKDTLSTLPL